MDDYTIEILEEKGIIRVHTKFDTSVHERSNIDGISYCSHLTRYVFDVVKGNLFTYEDVASNIRTHFATRDKTELLTQFERKELKRLDDLIHPKTVSIDLSKKIPLGPIDVFKDKEDKEEKEKWSKYLTKLNREAKEL